jgi:HlyD family secretion protein
VKLRCFTFLALLPLAAAMPGCSENDLPRASSSEAARPLEVDLVSVRRTRIASELELVGTLIPIRGTTIVPDVDGVIESFPNSDRLVKYLEQGELKSQFLGIDLGHEVKKGDVLVKIEDTNFRLAVAAAQAELELVRRLREELVAWKRNEEKQQAEAQLEEATATVALDEAQLERAEELRRMETISEGEFDVLVMNARCAVAAKKRAQAALDMANAGPTPEQIAVADARVLAAETQVKLMQDDLDKTTITAPYDGVIVDRFVDVGNRVQATPQGAIMQICDPRVLLAQVAVPEQYQRRIRLFDQSGADDEPQQVWVDADSLNERIAGRVDLINVKVEPETRTFRVRVLIDNRQGLLKPGGFVRVSLPIASVVDVPVVPEEAISYEEGQPVVFVYLNGQVKKRSVSVGLSNHQDCEIRSGLAGDELVVVSNTSLLADGLAVCPKANGPADAPVSAESNLANRSDADSYEDDGALASAATEVGR